ncbi:MAG TPA: hypothetical protein VFP48_09605, partial [Steroidobacteraceae bacterium]|nr:hypothetical protein [Steroidobacteraceae bacterium]
MTGYQFTTSYGYRWDSINGRVDIPTTNFPTGYGGSSVFPAYLPVNNSGVVGNSARVNIYDLPAIWSPEGGLQVLGGFDGNMFTTGAVTAINDSNQAVGVVFGGGYNS